MVNFLKPQILKSDTIVQLKQLEKLRDSYTKPVRLKENFETER